MANVVIPYSFPKGRYRAKVVTRYKDQNNVNQVIESEPYRFDSNAKEYFSFKTNPQIQIDLDTMEAPNATLVDEGQYFGFDYKTYDNGLIIVTGVQDTVLTASDRDAAPWNANDIEYCYADCEYISSLFLNSNTIIELHIAGLLNFSNTSTFILGNNYEYINIENLSSFIGNTNIPTSSIFRFKTVDLNGFGSMLTDYNDAISDGLLTDVSNLMSFSVHNNFVDIPYNSMFINLVQDYVSEEDKITAAAYIVSGDFENSKIRILTPHAFSQMANYGSVGDIKYLEILCEEYILDQFYGCKMRNLFIDCPIENAGTTFPFLNCPNLEILEFASLMNFNSFTSFSGAFRNCPNLKRVNKLSATWSTPFDPEQYDSNVFDLTNVTSISRMFSGCTYLEDPGLGDIIDDELEITFETRCNIQEAFYNCSSFNVDITLNFNYRGFATSTSAFEGSGITGLTINSRVSSSSSSSSLGALDKLCKNCANLVSAAINVYGKTSGTVVTMAEAFRNCINLENVYIYSEYEYSGSSYLGFIIGKIGYLFSGCSKINRVDFDKPSLTSSSSDTSEELGSFFDQNNTVKYVRLGYNSKAIDFHKNMERNDGVIVSIASTTPRTMYSYTEY